MKYLNFCVIFFTFIIFGCVTIEPTKITEKGKKVRIMKSDPPIECEEIRSISASGGLYGINEAKVILRNNAAKINGNYVRLETVSGQNAVILGGTVFKCP